VTGKKDLLVDNYERMFGWEYNLLEGEDKKTLEVGNLI
jgi:hypothetical protein